MRLSVRANYQAQLPKRNHNKTVVIELGKERVLKTLSSEKKDPESSKMNCTFNTSVEKDNLKSSRSMHKIKQKNKPVSLSKHTLQSPKTSSAYQSNPMQTETIRTLHGMIEELLHSKKKETGKNEDSQQTSHQTCRSQVSTVERTQIKKVTNSKARTIQISLPFANLDLVDPEFWLCYEGEMIGDSKQGHGTLYMTNGEKFTGRFQGNKATGNGTFYKKTGDVVIGVWKGNKLAKRLL